MIVNDSKKSTNDVKEFINNNYSFFTQDTRNKMIIGINSYLNHQQSSNTAETIITKEYYAIAMQLSESEDLMCCLVQEGTGNTLETSKLVEWYLPYHSMKSIITNKITDDLYVIPEQYFKFKVTYDDFNSKIEYQFFTVEQTKELEELFKKPDCFEDLGDVNFLNGDK
jgi:hypothetical protein